MHLEADQDLALTKKHTKKSTFLGMFSARGMFFYASKLGLRHAKPLAPLAFLLALIIHSTRSRGQRENNMEMTKRKRALLAFPQSFLAKSLVRASADNTMP